jgi:hypothetical protein
MRVKDLIYNYEPGTLELIKVQCTQFLEESGGLPVIKYLPEKYDDFQKVKVRKRKQKNTFSDMFNGAFKHELNSLRERSIFANGLVTYDQNMVENTDPFYIFPINGYKFLYSKEVENSTQEYKAVLESILDELGEKSGKDIFTDLLRFNYVSEDLATGIDSGAELIIYGIPYYYAVRKSQIDNYNELLTVLS